MPRSPLRSPHRSASSWSEAWTQGLAAKIPVSPLSLVFFGLGLASQGRASPVRKVLELDKELVGAVRDYKAAFDAHALALSPEASDTLLELIDERIASKRVSREEPPATA
ncbi:hypothetical protein Rhopal_004777-T1 [Rhodotorula paludigena]|uniref:Uncharacterized protein n=1 Tax=Rhodotorula paludigena TaxID=86838 RepID=A0AAV5GP99_9BASI|nr:hypothetical protein Rhopal_004777-T1 [Rhodotorula paludigena]